INAVMFLEDAAPHPSLRSCILSLHKNRISADELHAATAFIHSTRYIGHRILINSLNDSDAAFVIVAYLVEYLDMDLPNAYTLLANQYYMAKLPVTWLRVMVDSLGLSYSDRNLYNPYFMESLVSSVINGISAVHHGIYVSGIHALAHSERARRMGVRAVLRVDSEDRSFRQWASDFLLHDMPLIDGAEVPGERLSEAAAFIHGSLDSGLKVLVHCQMGVSRSVTMVLAYLIEYENMSLPDAVRLVVRRRAVAAPHRAMLRSLVQHYNLPYSLDETQKFDFFNQLLR
ncbi:MAG TPA: dual specificity protein phosphatase family protein, partial [Aggregatilineales bacterium]|nr:dual specificity protein phosphatase family protein [Aggregatilineales bacterium]